MKLPLALPRTGSTAVAPRRGAWVETPDRLSICVAGTVAPRRVAWVETAMTGLGFLRISSRAPQGAWVETPMVWDKKLGT